MFVNAGTYHSSGQGRPGPFSPVNIDHPAAEKLHMMRDTAAILVRETNAGDGVCQMVGPRGET